MLCKYKKDANWSTGQLFLQIDALDNCWKLWQLVVLQVLADPFLQLLQLLVAAIFFGQIWQILASDDLFEKLTNFCSGHLFCILYRCLVSDIYFLKLLQIFLLDTFLQIVALDNFLSVRHHFPIYSTPFPSLLHWQNILLHQMVCLWPMINVYTEIHILSPPLPPHILFLCSSPQLTKCFSSFLSSRLGSSLTRFICYFLRYLIYNESFQINILQIDWIPGLFFCKVLLPVRMVGMLRAIMGDIHSENIRLYTPPSVITGLLLWKLKLKIDLESKVKIDYMCS